MNSRGEMKHIRHIVVVRSTRDFGGSGRGRLDDYRFLAKLTVGASRVCRIGVIVRESGQHVHDLLFL